MYRIILKKGMHYEYLSTCTWIFSAKIIPSKGIIVAHVEVWSVANGVQ